MKNIESFKELEILAKDKKFYDVFMDLEVVKLERSREELINLMRNNLLDMQNSIKAGLSSSETSISGLSGTDSQKLFKRYESLNNLPFNKFLGKILTYAIAVTEENQRMGKIVACPTAGSCGILPAVIVAYGEEYNISEEKQIQALITAGGIGKIVAQNVSLAGAVAGCQAECGVASAMTAGAIVELMNGSNDEIINAAALALKNLLGLVCDPVAGLVEVPCIKRNGFYAIHSVTASEMAMAGIKSVIPLDEIVSAMVQIGNLMSPLLKECSEAGLATTPTAKRIEQNLLKKWQS